MLIGKHQAQVGESPVWDPIARCLWHIDVRGRSLIRTDWPGKRVSQHVIDLPDEPGSIFPLETGGVLIALPDGFYRFGGNGLSCSLPFAGVPKTHRFNDGTTDPAGRVLIGTMRRHDHPRAPDGDLWSFCPDRAPLLVASGFWTINGLAVSPDGRTLYLSDSAPERQKIWTAPYDLATGEVGAVSPLLDMKALAGRPDGAAFDADGNYWIAATEGSAMIRVGPSGTVEQQIEIPTFRPSKPCFAGDTLDRLVVTSIAINTPETDRYAGHLIELPCPGRGQPVTPSRIDL